MNKQEENKNAHPTKRGPGRFHGKCVPHGTPVVSARHGARVPRIVGVPTGLTSKQLAPQRLDGESFADYRQRRAFANRAFRGLAF